jgi:hypothetical protein
MSMLLLFVGAVLSAMPAVSLAQSSAPSLLLAVCGGGGCSRWEFHGEQATVAWPGFDYMYHAAREKNVYAMVYLAEFYRYGVGVEPNDPQAREIMNAATNRPGGEDAFEHAEGTFRSPSQGFAMLGNLFAASVMTDMECPETPAHYEIHGQQRVWVEASRAARCKTPEADAISDRIDIVGPNTLSTPEELYPENPFHSF